MAATIKHKMKVTDTEIPTAAATLALAVPCPGAVVPTGNNNNKKNEVYFCPYLFEVSRRM